jgi:cell pole-organizing protein PopZ
MSEPNQEPTMEEILASIRRIISEDEAPPAESEDPVVSAAPVEDLESEPEAEPIAEALPPAMEPPVTVEAVEDDEVLELTDRIEAPAETHGDIDVYPAQAEAESVPRPLEPVAAEEPLVGRGAAESAASAFGQLAHTLAMPRDGRTLEDVVRELLRPLLKAWLDEHLPGIVQAKVEAEVERIARGRR